MAFDNLCLLAILIIFISEGTEDRGRLKHLSKCDHLYHIHRQSFILRILRSRFFLIGLIGCSFILFTILPDVLLKLQPKEGKFHNGYSEYLYR